jgi:two-component system, LytTR family, sensor kinase
MKKLKNFSIKFGVVILIHLFFKVTTASNLAGMIIIDASFWAHFLYTFTVVFISWEIGERFYQYFSKRYEGIFMTAKPLLLMSLSTFFVVGAFLTLATYLMVYHLETAMGCPIPEDHFIHFFITLIWSQMITILFIAGFIIRHFWMYRQQSQILHDRIIKENLMYKYESLKNQLNPHFLFNNFSVLTSLIHKNPDMASDFITQLSKIYRYVLENKDRELVPVEQELDFLESYMFLLKIRHFHGIEVDYDIKILDGQFSIPSLSLQLLAENAAKHNSFSEEAPLKLEVYTEEGKYLVIRNTLRQRKRKAADSTKIGLKNIDERYQLLSELRPRIEKDEKYFTVKLPLIKQKTA